MLEGIAKQVVDLTGGRTKIIWVRGSRDFGGFLMCFDTDEGKERVVVPGQAKCMDPKLTPDGTRILFTLPDQTSYIVDWDGKNLRQLFKGRHHYILGVAVDGKTKTEWVYVGDNMSPETQAEIKSKGLQASDDSGLSAYRYKLADLSVKELVWDKMPFNRRVTVMADGSRMSGELPWPNCGVATLPNGEWKLFGSGCNATMAPDGSGMFFHMIGDHRSMKMYARDGTAMGNLIAINTLPGVEKDPKRSVWRPRWSNQVRFFTLQSADLGPDADISLGQFDEKFSSVKAWVRITHTPEYDADSLAWIEPGTELGVKLTDNLKLPLLQTLVVRLEGAQDLKPVALELAALATDTREPAKAAEAQRLIAHLRRWVAAALARAQALESEDIPNAVKSYQGLAARFKGTGLAAVAEERLRDPALAKEYRAWAYLEKVQKTEKELREVKDAQSCVTDKKWMARNTFTVSTLKDFARILQQNYTGTVAWTKVQEILAKYEIAMEQKK
jgi:hypothetical protein